MTKMDHKDHDWLIEPIAILFIIIVFSFGGIVIGAAIENSNMKRKAVDAGVAEYYLDRDNMKQFRYINGNGNNDKQAK